MLTRISFRHSGITNGQGAVICFIFVVVVVVVVVVVIFCGVFFHGAVICQ